MKKMKVFCTFLFLLHATMNYPVNWKCCCFLFFFEEKVRKKNKEKKSRGLKEPFNDGGEEMETFSSSAFVLPVPPILPERSKTPTLKRNNSDLVKIIVSVPQFQNVEQFEVPRDGTPWKKAGSVFVCSI